MTTKGDPDWLWEFHAEDFVHARLHEELTATHALQAGDQRENAINRIESLRLAVVQHSPYVDRDGRSWARCITCDPACGFPCSTMRYFTRMWRHHPDYWPAWNDTLDGPSGPTKWETDQMRIAELGGYRHNYLANHPEVTQ